VIDVNARPPLTGTGTLVELDEPLPRRPFAPYPQQCASPAAVSAQV
jgi:hypothetical protein